MQIEELAQDHLSGARECTKKALDLLLTPTSLEELIPFAKRVVRTKPEITSILRTVDHCLSVANEAGLDVMKEEIQRLKMELDHASATIAKQAAYLPAHGDQILTHSGSETVFEALVQAHSLREIEVIVTESRPMFEGRKMAEALADRGVPTIIVTDAAGASMLPYCQAIWIGADTIGKSFIVNKVGTFPLALVAKSLNIPVFVLSDSWKILPKGRGYHPRDHHPGNEVLPTAHQHLRVLNPYFEKVPLDLVKGIVTEKGMITGQPSLPPVKSQIL